MKTVNHYTQHPDPAPEMHELDFFIGIFEGTGTTSPTPVSDGYPLMRKITGNLDLGGFWLFMRFEDHVTNKNPNPILGIWQLGYDQNNEQFIGIWTDNLGRWFEQTSEGWNNNTIIFTGSYRANDEETTVRDTFEKTGEQVMKLTVDVKKGKNDWVTFLEINLQKE